MNFLNYLANLLPKLSEVTEPIRQRTRKDVPWNWSASQENAFLLMKELIKEAHVLQFFDNNKPLIIQFDTSEKGFGAALLQDGKPVAFTSRAITDTETQYAQIEKELLAIVFSVDKFDQFTVGRTVYVYSDHKLLESILKKPLHRASKRLQSMILHLQRYDILVSYVSGKLLYLFDTVFRAFKPSNQPSPQSNLETVSMIANVSMTETRFRKIKSASAIDSELQLLKTVILKGWPTDKLGIPPKVFTKLPYKR